MKLRFAVKTKLYQGMMKLIVNVISGKCVANSLSDGRSEFCFTASRPLRLLARDNLQDVAIISSNCCLFVMSKRCGPEENLRLQEAVIYELSKIRLYTLFHHHIRLQLLLSNTDSFIQKVKLDQDSLVEKLKGLSSIMDFFSPG